MKPSLLIILCALAGLGRSLCFAESPDQLTFSNGDHLHGVFEGASSPKVISWQHADANASIEFESKNIHRVLFNHGHPLTPTDHQGWVKLNNQDILPGDIVAITDKHISLTTDYAGTLKIPTHFVSSLSPHSGSGKTLYKGPFHQKDWQVIELHDGVDYELGEDEEFALHPWEFYSSAWFSTNKRGFLKKEDLLLPEKYRITFDLYSKSFPGISLILSADFQPPEVSEKHRSDQVNQIFSHFGSCLLLRTSGNSLALYQYWVRKDGSIAQQRIPHIAKQNQLIKALGAKIEIRVDRQKSTLQAFVDGQFLSLWQIPDTEALKHHGIGFSSYGNRLLCRISDILIQQWSGLRDSVASLSHDELDVVILHNNTDRFSGTHATLNGQLLSIEGSYANYSIPAEDIKELHFALNTQTPLKEPDTAEVSVKFYGEGQITGTLLSATKEHIHIDTVALGPLEIQRSHLSEILFDDSLLTLDSWTTER